MSLVILAAVFGAASLLLGWEGTPDAKKRPVSVADGIEMTRIAGSGYPAVRPKSGFAVFSPDGSYFAIVLSKGNVGKNTNDYSLLLFRTADVSRASLPRLLTLFSSSSNREGIFHLMWSRNNKILFFLGTRGNEPTELYSIQCRSGELKRLTNHETSLLSYAVSEEDGTIVYAAESRETDIIDENALRHGFHVTTERLSDLINGRTRRFERELFVKGNGLVSDRRLRTRDPFDSDVNNLFLSPNGRYLVVKTDTKELPESWNRYEDMSIQIALRRRLPKGFPTRVLRYELIDTRTGNSEVLIDSPATFSPSDVMWSHDSKSLLLCGVLLPLNVDDPIELESRRSSKFVVEITLPGRTFVKITNQELSPVQWDAQTNVVQFHVGQNQNRAGSVPETVHYRKTGEVWERSPDDSASVNDCWPDILAEQDLDLPPRIVSVDPKTKRKTTILDLNPQFAELAFGKVEEINWQDGTGNHVSGGLYLPPNYIPGKKYPLVIQTHGFEPNTFVIDGPHMTASAAQSLASRGIVVLQIRDIFYDSLDTPQEAERAMRAYETAVEYLDTRGIIDSRLVGLVGFSRTSLYVKYTLTHSRRHFAAAIVSDGIDAGYFQYLMDYNADPTGASEFDSIIGSPPFGAGLSLWLKNSPGFLLDKVQTPLLIQALGPDSILGEWQWFGGLKRLEKPVAMVYLPAASHVLVRPWDRIVSQEGALDWFSFWLKGEEDRNPAKAQEYLRWREFRTQVSNPQPLD